MRENKQTEGQGEAELSKYPPLIQKFCTGNYFISYDSFLERIYYEVLLPLKESTKKSDHNLLDNMLVNALNPEGRSLLEKACLAGNSIHIVDLISSPFIPLSPVVLSYILKFHRKPVLEKLIEKVDSSVIKAAFAQANGSFTLWHDFLDRPFYILLETSDYSFTAFIDFLLTHVTKDSLEETFQANKNRNRDTPFHLLSSKDPDFSLTLLLKLKELNVSLDVIAEALLIIPQQAAVDFLNKGLTEDWWSPKDLVAILKKQIQNGGPCNTLLHIAATSSSISPENFAKLLRMISSKDKQLINQIAQLPHKKEGETLFSLIEKYKKEEKDNFLKKINIDTPFAGCKVPWANEDIFTWKKNKRNEFTKQIIENHEVFTKDLTSLWSEYHPSWISLTLESYQEAYAEVISNTYRPFRSSLSLPKSTLLLVKMFHLNATHFHINNFSLHNAPKCLLFSTLKIILTQPANEIAEEMQNQNNPGDIAQLIELLGLYIDDLPEGIEKIQAQLKMIDYAEQFKKYQKKSPAEDKEKSPEEAEPLIPEEEGEIAKEEGKIIAITSEETAAFLAINRILSLYTAMDNIEEHIILSFTLLANKKRELEEQLALVASDSVQKNDITAEKTSPPIIFLEEKKISPEDQLSDEKNLEEYKQKVKDINSHLHASEPNSSFFLNLFRRIWHYFFPPRSEIDYFKKCEELQDKRSKVAFISEFLTNSKKASSTSTQFKKLFKEPQTNLEASLKAEEKTKVKDQCSLSTTKPTDIPVVSSPSFYAGQKRTENIDEDPHSLKDSQSDTQRLFPL